MSKQSNNKTDVFRIRIKFPNGDIMALPCINGEYVWDSIILHSKRLAQHDTIQPKRKKSFFDGLK